MNSFVMFLSMAILIIGVSSVNSKLLLPNVFRSAQGNQADIKQPENTVVGQSLQEMGIEICPDKLHLCPGTTECCKNENGKWDCCAKAAIPMGGECCMMYGVWSCCTFLVPKCHDWGCWWT